MIFDDDAISSYIYPSVSDHYWAEPRKFNLLTVRGRGQGPLHSCRLAARVGA